MTLRLNSKAEVEHIECNMCGHTFKPDNPDVMGWAVGNNDFTTNLLANRHICRDCLEGMIHNIKVGWYR